jgi:hypothetical protein
MKPNKRFSWQCEGVPSSLDASVPHHIPVLDGTAVISRCNGNKTRDVIAVWRVESSTLTNRHNETYRAGLGLGRARCAVRRASEVGLSPG